MIFERVLKKLGLTIRKHNIVTNRIKYSNLCAFYLLRLFGWNIFLQNISKNGSIRLGRGKRFIVSVFFFFRLKLHFRRPVFSVRHIQSPHVYQPLVYKSIFVYNFTKIVNLTFLRLLMIRCHLIFQEYPISHKNFP